MSCDICGRGVTTCEECGRCPDRDCNAGCIFCRPREEWDPLTRGINEHPALAVTVIVGLLLIAALAGLHA